MATPSPQSFARYAPGNDRRKTLKVVRLEKRETHVSSMPVQDSPQPGGSMTETQRVASMTPSNDPSARTLKCAICIADNPISGKFCDACGSPLSLRVCPQCGTIHARNAKNCIGCGFVAVAEDADAISNAVAPASPVPPTQPLTGDGHTIETIEKDWRALLQQIEEQVDLQAKQQAHELVEEQMDRQVEDQVHRLIEEQSHRQVEEEVRRHVETANSGVKWDLRLLLRRLAGCSAALAGVHRYLRLFSSLMVNLDLKRPLQRLAGWWALAARLCRSMNVRGLLLGEDAKQSLWMLVSWAAIVAGTGVLVYLLVAPPRPLLARAPQKSIAGNSVAPAEEEAGDARQFVEGTIIRETTPGMPTPASVVARLDEEGASTPPPERVSARTTISSGPAAEAAPAPVKQRASAGADRRAAKPTGNARPVQAVAPKGAPAHVAVAKPLMARAGRGTTTPATGNRRVEAPLTKPEPLRAPESQPCPPTSGMATPCGENTVAVVDAKSNVSQTASPASLQPEHAAKIPATGADLVASPPALGQAALPTQASAPETTASATVNAPVQPASAVVPMADQSSTAVPKTSASPIAKPVHREDPAFPREAITEGITSGSVKARLIIAGNGTVNSVTIVESQPRRVFDKAVIRALKRWQFEPTGAPQTVETEVEFSAGN